MPTTNAKKKTEEKWVGQKGNDIKALQCFVFMRMSWEGWEEGGKNQDEC